MERQTRREFLKAIGLAAAAGAISVFAGCAGLMLTPGHGLK
jgi:hypothetical protein